MKRFALGFLLGALLLVSVTAVASGVVERNIAPNSFDIIVDGETRAIEAYNIDGRTFLQLRAVAELFEGAEVDFVDGAIVIETGRSDAVSYETPPLSSNQEGVPMGFTRFSDIRNIPLLTGQSLNASPGIDGLMLTANEVFIGWLASEHVFLYQGMTFVNESEVLRILRDAGLIE